MVVKTAKEATLFVVWLVNEPNYYKLWLRIQILIGNKLGLMHPSIL